MTYTDFNGLNNLTYLVSAHPQDGVKPETELQRLRKNLAEMPVDVTPFREALMIKGRNPNNCSYFDDLKVTAELVYPETRILLLDDCVSESELDGGALKTAKALEEDIGEMLWEKADDITGRMILPYTRITFDFAPVGGDFYEKVGQRAAELFLPGGTSSAKARVLSSQHKHSSFKRAVALLQQRGNREFYAELWLEESP